MGKVYEISEYIETFCACAFISYILLVGGFNDGFLDSCMAWKKTNVKTFQKWTRQYAACTVFQGRVVVTGRNSQGFLNTVEAYDHLSDTWSSLPSMIEERLCHSSVDTSNKLHVIENINTAKNKTCGVFDSACNKFVALKHIPKKLTDELFRVETESFSIGKKPLITRNDLSFAFICDVEKD